MPVPRIIPSCVDVHVRYQHGTNLLENVYQFVYNAIPTSGELLQLATEFGTAIYNAMRTELHTGVVFREVRADDIGGSNRATATYVYPLNSTGTKADPPVASNEAASMVLYTGRRGRQNRGRKSYSEFVEPSVDGNTLGNFIMSMLVGVAAQILLPRVGGLFTPVVASFVGQITNQIVQAAMLDNNIDSQKTRLNQHGA